MIKICLDAGHCGKYNQSPAVKTYYESEMNWKLHLLLKKYLEQYGIEVVTTRADQTKDMGLKARGKASKGCNLFLSIHSNAVGSAVNDEVDYPLVIVPINGSGDVIGSKLAKCIETTMRTKQKANVWDKKSDSGTDWYGVINGATSVGVTGLILEHSFHTNTRSAKWLSDDSNLDKLAKAEADVIASHYGIKKPTVEYKVTASGVLKDKVKVDSLVAQLKSEGFTVTVSEVNSAPVPTPAPKPTIKVGSKVRIKSGAKSYDGVKMASFVYNNVYTVDTLQGDRAVLDKSGICTAFHVNDLIIVS